MKKLKDRETQINLAKKRFAKYLKRKNKKRTKKKVKIKYSSKKTYTAPENCSLVSNTKNTLEFIEQSLDRAKKGCKVIHDFRGIKNITPDVLLYIMSLVEKLQIGKIPFHIHGKYKKEFNVLFRESGFVDYLTKNNKEIENINSDVLAIKTGVDTKPEIAKAVVQRLREWLSLERSETKPIYKILIECMTNTKNHAYATPVMVNKWYLMAYHERDSVQFVFLDNGLGIAKTLQRNWKDLFKGIFSDEKLVKSALEGRILRSQTGQEKRGKGLPAIRQVAQNIFIEKLTIITNKAKNDCKNDLDFKLGTEFEGTLLTWKIKKVNENE